MRVIGESSGRNLGSSIGIHALDELLEYISLDPPLTPTTHLYRGKLAASHQCIGLRRRNIQRLRDVGKGQKPGHMVIVPKPMVAHQSQGQICGNSTGNSRREMR